VFDAYEQGPFHVQMLGGHIASMGHEPIVGLGLDLRVGSRGRAADQGLSAGFPTEAENLPQSPHFANSQFKLQT